MLFRFVFFISGMLFVVRTMENLERKRLLDRKALTKIGTAYLFAIIVVTLFIPQTFNLAMIAALTAVFWIVPHWLISRRNRRFQRSFLTFLNQIILNMNAGNSFRQSFEQTKRRCDPVTQAKLSEIMGFVAFSQQASQISTQPFLREIVDELKIVDQQPHRALHRLRTLRRKMKQVEDFRRKSGQVTQQLRAQALILSLLYLGLAIFMSLEFDLLNHLKMIAWSAGLFSAGSLLLLNTGKRFRWKT